eukprot:2621826-Pyramimonas_sp.AAC.1
MRQDPVPSLEMRDGSAILHHPKDIVDFKPDKWHRKWAPPISDPDEALGDVLETIRQAIRDDLGPLPELGVEDVRRALKPRAGMGGGPSRAMRY